MPLFNGDGYKAFRIGADGSNNAIEIRHTGNVDIPLTLPTGFLERDYTAIMAQVISDQGTGTSIVTSAATSPWSVTVNKPTFTRVVFYNGDASVTVNAPDDIADGEIALLKVTIVGNDGGTTVASRALKAVDPGQLAGLATAVNRGTDMAGKYFKQMTAVSLSAYSDWVAIGTEDDPFRGNYNGDGKTVSDLSITYGGGENATNMPACLGLFGCLDGGVVENISVNGTIGPVQFEKSQNVGAVIGYLKSGTVGNIKATVSITTTSSTGLYASDVIRVGGAIGRSDPAPLSDIFSVNPTISFSIDGTGIGYVGHNVGYCEYDYWRDNPNLGYEADDPAISISRKGGLAKLYINGVQID